MGYMIGSRMSERLTYGSVRAWGCDSPALLALSSASSVQKPMLKVFSLRLTTRTEPHA